MIRHKILLVEDDRRLAQTLIDFFELNDLSVLYASDGEMAMDIYKNNKPDVILLDVSLPKKNGLEVIEEIRCADKKTPVILMTGHEFEEKKQIKGYELGALNYFRKPVLPKVILTQIKMQLQAQDPKKIMEINLPGFRFCLQNNSLKINEQVIKTREREMIVLSMLCEHQNETVSRKEFMNAIWNNDNTQNGNMLDGIIFNLKKILHPYQDMIRIETVYALGYMLKVQ